MTDPGQFGEWIADVERPAEQFRGRYQLRLDEADGLLKSGARRPGRARRPVAPVAPAAPVADAPAPAGTVRAEDVDPATLGQEGTGGKPTPEGLALLENKNIVFDDVGVSDIKAGKIDPRVIAVLTKLSQEHKITVSCMCSDHDKFTAGGSVSNHSFGRGLDIAAIDGEIVSPSSPLAREIASELSSFDPSIRPDEIGSPFAINGPGYFTDAAHMNHVHVGFKTELSPDFDLPDDLAAAGAARRPAPPAPSPPRPSWPRRCPRASRASSPPSPSPRPSSARSPPRPRARSPVGLRRVRRPEGAARRAPRRPRPRRPPPRRPARPTYPGDDAPKEQIAAWMAAEAEKRGLPGQLPVMAALVESNLTNVDFGDADSLGYFQMRVSIWESKYPGFADDPEKQIDWFLDQAEAVKAQRVVARPVRHRPGPVRRVDRRRRTPRRAVPRPLPTPPRRGRHAAQGAPDAPAAPAARPPRPPRPRTPSPTPRPRPSRARRAPKALAALAEAEKYTGTPYKWGGSTPATGFDCSGLVQWAYAKVGIQIPRVTLRPDRRAERHAGPPCRAPPRRPRLLPRRGRLRAPRRHLDGRRQVPPRAAHRRRREGLEPRRAVLQGAVHRRPPLRRRGRRRSRRAAPRHRPPRPWPIPPPSPPPRPRWSATRPPRASAGSGVFKAITAQEAAKAKALAAELLDGKERATADVTGGTPDGITGGPPPTRRRARPGTGPAGPDRVVGDGVEAPDGEGAGLIGAPDGEDPARDSGIFAAIAAAKDRAAEPTPAAAAAPPPTRPRPRPTPRRRPPRPRAPAAPAADVPAGPPPDLADVPADYPGNDASQEALAKWLAKRAEKAGLPPELPVMAALVESGVKNLNFGDADSVGFFQMRLSIWNQGEYAGYPSNPELQIKWFIDHAAAHKRAQIAAGDRDFGKDPGTWGEWIADVERPAEQYRGRYQLRLAEARKLLR